MFALVDCNNFFVSCERVRNPLLESKPVIVLSNNDGCAVALSNEVKALGIKRGVPLFKIKEMVHRHNIHVLSGDHRYYSALSGKVMESLAELDLNLEIYSIDEAYLTIPPDLGEPAEFGRYIVKKIKEDTGIPVSIGIAATRTLAKVAARFAKKYPGYRGCCLIDSEERRLKALELTDIADVWGIGRRLSPQLKIMGIRTALQFAQLSVKQAHDIHGVNAERTWRELNGEPCIEYVHDETSKSIMASRSFERDIYTLGELEQAVCVFAGIIGKKLRKQGGYATQLSVFVATNRFRTNSPQYKNSALCMLPEATDFTPALASAAREMLRKVFRSGYGYKRAGVAVPKVVPAASVQLGLFDDPDILARKRRLMQVTDSLALKNPAAPPVRIAAIGDGLRSLVAHKSANGDTPPEIFPHVGENTLPFGF